MKKNLFLLFSIYFFVLQPLIIGALRGQANFFRLAAINLIAIVLIGLFSASSSEESKKENKEHENAPIKEAKVSFHDHLRAAVKERKKKSELIFPAIISFIAAIIIFFIFQHNSAIEVMILFSLIIGFIVFTVLTGIFKHHVTKGFWSLIGTKIYIILLVCSLALTAYGYYQVHQNFNASLGDYIAQNLLGQERIPTDGYVFTGEGTILGSGLGTTTGVEEVSSDVFSGMTADSNIQEETGTVLGTSGEQPVPTNDTTTTDAVATIGNQKLMDAVIYLLKKYDIPLITKHDLSFTYVSFQNPYYNEWRTAYTNKLIGKNTNPSKYIVCESYIVMKGLLEKRDVSYTSSTVLANFWAEAVRRDALNGCVKGKIVTDKTL
ncbi:MAG: hypothetical protein WC606_05225 [Candidatus Absconditabacterales bacterium]